MPRDLEKARARRRRYLDRKKAELHGLEVVGVDLRGKHGNHRRGADHPRWNDGRMLNEDGYVKVRVGVTHPLADPNGYAYEHLVVWAAAGNSLPAPNELLHHRNEVKTDNRLSNLELMPRPDHGRHHIATRERDLVTGRLLDGVEHNGMPEVRHAG